MTKGRRETAYHVIISEKCNSVPFKVIEIPTAEAFRKWKRQFGLQLHKDLVGTGHLYGQLKSGEACYIIKGKVVVPIDGVTI